VAFSDAYSKSEVYFKNGHLQKSTLIQKVNDKEREKTDISYNGTHYRIQRKGEVASDLKNSILYSIAMLYHTEPEGKKNVFSERYGKFFDIKKIDANRYELALPDGKKTFYTYENGICTRVQTKQMLMDVRFELLN
jgi:hypothetical protein